MRRLHSDTVIQFAFFLAASVNLKPIAPLVVACAALAGCLGNSGTSLPPPSDVTPIVGDGMAGVKWTPQVGVNYLAVAATTPTLTIQNWADAAINGFALINLGSISFPPTLFCNNNYLGAQSPGAAVNGLAYYFTVDAHTGTSPGGSGSPVVQSIPRPAGGVVNGVNTWSPGTPMPTGGIQGAGYAPLSVCLPSGPPTGVYTAVGSGGTIFTSPDGRTWTARSSGVSTDLYGIASYTLGLNNPIAPGMLMVAVGQGGATVRSGDTGITWSVGTPYNAAEPILRSVSWSGTAFVAVGDGGRIQASPDGVSWNIVNSGTSYNLYAIDCVGTTCVAVGDGASGTGTAEVSFDGGASWTAFTLTGGALRGVTYGSFDNNENPNGTIGNGNIYLPYATPINTWVLVGDNATAYQSTGVALGMTAAAWTAAPVAAAGTAGLVAVGYTTQFVAVDGSGNAYTNRYGTPDSWKGPFPSGIVDPAAMTSNQHGYILVGTSGDNAGAF